VFCCFFFFFFFLKLWHVSPILCICVGVGIQKETTVAIQKASKFMECLGSTRSKIVTHGIRDRAFAHSINISERSELKMAEYRTKNERLSDSYDMLWLAMTKPGTECQIDDIVQLNG